MKKEISGKARCIKPSPSLLVTCRDKNGRNNGLVVTFAANISIDPPLVMIGVVPSHYSCGIIQEAGEFVINIPVRGFEKEYRYFGSVSGREEDKFAAMQIAWENAAAVNAPLLSDCPISVECKVIGSVQPGTHVLFMASVEAVHCEESLLDENGAIAWDRVQFL